MSGSQPTTWPMPLTSCKISTFTTPLHPASAPPHMLPPLVCLFVYLCHWHTCCLFCLFVSPSGLVLLIDGQWTSAKSDCTHSIRRGLGRRLRSSLLLNSSPSTSRDHPLVTYIRKQCLELLEAQRAQKAPGGSGSYEGF